MCRYRHVRRKEVPEIADFTIGRESLTAKRPHAGTENTSGSIPTGQPRENYKVSMCKNFMNDGNCPYGEDVSRIYACLCTIICSH